MTQTTNDALLAFGAILLPHRAGIDLSQSLELDGGHSYPVTHGGAMKHQGHFDKWISQVSAQGCFMPSPFSQASRSTAAELSCVVPLAIYSTSNVIVLPAARRADAGYEIWAVAQRPDGEIVDTAVSVGGDGITATLTAVSGALQYVVHYYPKFTAFLTAASQSVQDAEGTWSWQATFRQQ